MKANRKKHRFLRALLSILLILAILVGGYAAYVFLGYRRLPDMLYLTPENNADGSVKTQKEYRVISFNIGFGAYEPDYSFFMDGGTESWAFSRERLEKNMAAIQTFLNEQDADFLLLQEVDENGTRTYHYNERAYLTESLAGYGSVWAQDWDGPFLLYPFRQPHGKNVCGLMTFSRARISAAVRRSLPVENTVMKVADLDRCYSVCRMPIDSERDLVLYNVHLSAYTSDGTIANEQLALLLSDMESEYAKGNYTVCGGDFNKDLLGNSAQVFGVSGKGYTWAQPLPEGLFEGTHLSLAARCDAEHPVPSSRVAEAAYHPGQFVVTLDGFIVSDNVTVVREDTIDTGFAYSDHNPVELVFRLEE